MGLCWSLTERVQCCHGQKPNRRSFKSMYFVVDQWHSKASPSIGLQEGSTSLWFARMGRKTRVRLQAYKCMAIGLGGLGLLEVLRLISQRKGLTHPHTSQAVQAHSDCSQLMAKEVALTNSLGLLAEQQHIPPHKVNIIHDSSCLIAVIIIQDTTSLSLVRF